MLKVVFTLSNFQNILMSRFKIKVSICNNQTKRGKGEIHMLIVKKSSIVNN